MDCNKLMNHNERQFLRLILNVLSEQLDLDVQAMNDVFKLQHNDAIEHLLQNKEYDTKKCKVCISNGKQCSRKHNHSGFCLTHFKMFNENQLDPKKIISFQKQDLYMKSILQKMKEKQQHSVLMNTQLFIHDENEYLLDKYTGMVYDFESYEKIGKLDKFNQIKYIYEIDVQV